MAGPMKGWRHRLSRWIDPSRGDRVVFPAAPTVGQPSGPRHAAPASDEDATAIWSALSEQFAVRILTAAYQMGSHLDAVEADEQDSGRLEQLYRLDHAIS